MNGSLDMHVSN